LKRVGRGKVKKSDAKNTLWGAGGGKMAWGATTRIKKKFKENLMNRENAKGETKLRTGVKKENTREGGRN